MSLYAHLAAGTDDMLYSLVPNTDGIDTYRSDNISLLNWDITCGDDCLAIKGVSGCRVS